MMGGTMTNNGKNGKKPKKMGRPTIRTQKLEDRLLRHVADGKTIRAFCRKPNTPTWQTIYSWVHADQVLSGRLARARDIGAAMIEDEIQDIADGKDAGDDQDVARRKLRIYVREQRLVWNNPRRYGKNLQVNQRHEHTLVLTETERGIRLNRLLKKAGGPQIEVEIEPTEPEENDE